VTEALRERIVEVQLRPEARDGDAVGALADHRFDGIARRDVEEQEGDDEHAEERRHGEQQSAEDEATHGFGASMVTSSQR
jgi:hypothetical protein